MATENNGEIDRLRDQLRTAIRGGDLDGFIRSAAGPALSEWLNGPEILCHEFLASALGARAMGVHPALGAERAAALRWYDRAALIVSSARPSSGDFTAAVTAAARIEAPLHEAVSDFLLRRTRVPSFHGVPHMVLFLHFYCEAGRAGRHGDLTAARTRDDPAWFAGYQTRSCIARVMGPEFIPVLVKAAEGADRATADLARALERVTGLPRPADTARYLSEVRSWYRESRPNLVVNPLALYPAPLKSPTFMIDPGVRPVNPGGPHGD